MYLPYWALTRFNANIQNIKPTKYEIYQVKHGDSLASIGKKYKIKYQLIRSFNNLTTNFLSVKQKLIIPIDPLIIKRDIIYIVKSGDNLGRISSKYKISLNKIKKDNHLKTSMIQIGDKIVLKYN